MSQYQIRDIEHLSGIKAHTIRIWEKRYSIIEPKRTTTNRRYYDDSDLKRILNISILNRSGYKISKIARLTNARLNDEILRLTNESQDLESQIGNLIRAMIDFDQFLFEKIFAKSVMNRGFQETLLKLIYPFFKRTGILWLTENIDPAHEHFISNIVRQKIIAAIDGLPDYRNGNAENFLLFLPESQWHELGLLMCNYLIRKNGHHSIYLGSSLPIASVMKLEKIVSFSTLVTTTSFGKSNQELEEEIRRLASIFNDKTIFVGGLHEEFCLSVVPENIHIIDKLEEFNRYLVQENN
ncbi:MAG: MerR family transcriptional regulator [Bacteroidales bacterium]|nr:MerR family transcriptional regulator [Bacteroidales bacterium]MCF8455786.1 MerR family transcriptional regulator [Bacteroidales bacterium]